MKQNVLTEKLKSVARELRPYLKHVRWLIMSAFTTMYWYLDSEKYILPKKLARKSIAAIPGGKVYLYFRNALTEYDVLSVVLLIALYVLYSRTPRFKGNRGEKALAMLFSGLIPLLTILARSYDLHNNWDYLFGSEGAVIITVIKTLGFGLLVYAVLCILSHQTLRVQTTLRKPLSFGREVILNAVILLVFWAPYFYLLYPGCFSPDSKDQLAQAVGNASYCWSAAGIELTDPNVLINTHHAVIYTYILKLTLKLGVLLHSYSKAFALLCLGQAGLLALSFGYLLGTLKRYGARQRVYLASLAFFALNPLFPSYAMTVIKDTPHCAFMVLAFVMTYEMLTVKRISAKRYAAYLGIMVLFALTRNNVLYVLAPVIVLTVIILWKDKKRMLKTVSVMVATVLIVGVGFGAMIYPALHISKGSSREMLAVPINQTARYIVEHGDEITPEEEEVILRIFSNNDEKEGTSLEIIAEKYDPVIADPVKYMYDKHTDMEDLKDYLSVWLSQLKKHPDTYIQAYLNIHYGWFSFEGNNQIAYSRVEDKKMERLIEGFDNAMGSFKRREVVNYFESFIIKNPLTAPFIETATYSWLYIALFFILLKKKKWNALLTASLVYFNYLIYLAGPVSYLRYAIPMVCVAPFAVFITFCKNEKRMEDV